VSDVVGDVAGFVVGADVVGAGGVLVGGAEDRGAAVCVAGWVVGGTVVGCVVWAVADDERTVPTLVPDGLGPAGVDPTVADGTDVLFPDCVGPPT